MEAKTVVAGVIAFGLVLGLTACVPAGARGDDPTDPEQSSTSSPSEPPATIEGDSNEDGVLSEFEKQILAQNAPRDFAMPDGSTIRVDPSGPLPPAVKEVITEQARPVVAPIQSNRDFSPESVEGKLDQIRTYAESQSQATGKPIVVVFSQPDGAGAIGWGSIASGRKSTGVPGGYDRDTVVGNVQSWADRTGYEVIVLD